MDQTAEVVLWKGTPEGVRVRLWLHDHRGMLVGSVQHTFELEWLRDAIVECMKERALAQDEPLF